MSNSIIRQLKIAMITEEPNHLLDWFNDLWSRLFIIETNVFHENGDEFIYYIDSNVVNDQTKQWIFFQDNKNERFWCNYDNYWSILENNNDFEYSVIQEVTKLLVENALNNEVTTPGNGCEKSKEMVENALNNEVTTPCPVKYKFFTLVENALNNEVTTPSFVFWNWSF